MLLWLPSGGYEGWYIRVQLSSNGRTAWNHVWRRITKGYGHHTRAAWVLHLRWDHLRASHFRMRWRGHKVWRTHREHHIWWIGHSGSHRHHSWMRVHRSLSAWSTWRRMTIRRGLRLPRISHLLGRLITHLNKSPEKSETLRVKFWGIRDGDV